MRSPLLLFLLLLLLVVGCGCDDEWRQAFEANFLGGGVGPQEPDSPQAFAAAMNLVFALQGQSERPENVFLCRRRLLNLMQRQQIPANIAVMRDLSDAELYRLGILAALAGLGPWKRDPTTDGLVVDDQGMVAPALVPSAVESDVMLCIICALLTVIAVFHVILPSSSSSDEEEAGGTTTTTPSSSLAIQDAAGKAASVKLRMPGVLLH